VKPLLIIFFFHLTARLSLAQGIPPIGEWREHLPYNSAIGVTSGEGKIFCATPYGLFSVDLQSNEIERYSRMTGLSETGISAIAYDGAAEKLFIAYSNSNIDILSRKYIVNIPGIKQSTAPGNKSISRVYPYQGDYFLSTGLGVIIIDGDRNEVRDTWYPGTGGNPVPVHGFATDATHYYAATGEGLKRVPLNASDPANPSSWELVSGTGGLAPGPVQNVLQAGGRIFAEKNDTLFVLQGNSWNVFYEGGQPVINTSAGNGKLVVCERSAGGIGRITILNTDGSVYRLLNNTGAVSFPKDAILLGDQVWVADQFACLSRVLPSGVYENYTPNSPQAVAGGEMVFRDGSLYVTAGSVNDAWNYQYNGDGVFIFSEGQWKNINRYNHPALDSLLDFITIAPHPFDGSVWAGSFGGGLLHIKQGSGMEIFKQGFIGETIGDPSSYRVSGLAFDKERNLWIANFGSSQPLRARKADGTWRSFSIPFPLFERAVSQLIIDQNNFKWMVSPLGNGLVVFDHGSSIDDASDDRWRLLRTGSGNGNLPSNGILCLALDKLGFIWVGTADGIAVFECPGDIFGTLTCDATWPVVPNGNFSGYLFKGQEVRSIAVDGANRKWVATRNGVFLVAPGGQKLEYRFTEDNSPLLSSDVRRIAIDGRTGEVFFATLKGICSFRSTATEGGEVTEDPITIFPNPVPPGFTGTIGIRGLKDQSIVKITELDGRLVYQARALGGQAVWDGRNYRGQKISSGVYLVLVIGENGKENAAGRIFFISK
jgi:hypothetical protein